VQRIEKTIQCIVVKIPPYSLVASATVLTVMQFVLAFFYHGADSALWEWLGWVCLWSAGIFGVVPILVFRKYGGVKQGNSYICTTRLVTHGIYALVRHPQNGTSWMLINLGLMLIVRHWSNYLTGGLSILLAYLDTHQADQRCIEKFGNDYRDYMTQVPRVNFLLGLILLIQKRFTKR
jgi:protein-S-isoprenylcysteine O-methyltransferase Ste14